MKKSMLPVKEMPCIFFRVSMQFPFEFALIATFNQITRKDSSFAYILNAVTVKHRALVSI